MSDISPAAPEASPRLVQPSPPAPEVPSLELERLRREVKARLFGSTSEALTIGRYAVLGCIGTGGMGIVYAARDERLGRRVAIKLLKPELSGRHTTDLAGEARSLAQLSHPNVVAVYDVGEHEGQLFIAMEFVEGQNLRRWLQTPRELSEILDVFIAAGEGLAAAHEAGLVHRDFKPDNVLVGSDRRPRILDFGLAKGPDAAPQASPPAFGDDAEPMLTSLSRHGVLLGTPAYMAPEQHLGERADARSDQFGFCVALFQAVHGELPFPSDDLRSLSLAIVGGRIRQPTSKRAVPPALQAAILRGLSIHPRERFADMHELLGELRRIRDELATLGSTSASPPSAPAKPEPMFDTRAIQRVFGVEAAAADSSGRPPLSASEMAEIADEVGLALVPDATPPAKPDAASSASPTSPQKRSSFGFVAHVRVEHELPGLPGPATVRRVIRELEQNLGGVGMVEQFETGLVWANAEAEATIDRRAGGGALLTIRRTHAKLAHKRRRRGMLLGAFVGMIVGGTMADTVAPFLAMFEPLFFFGGLTSGIALGHTVAKDLHERELGDDRRHLEWLAGRIHVLIAGEAEHKALAAGESR